MIERIRAGIEGKYEGLDNGLERINDYIFGVQKACYTLIGGLSGSAKTTLLDFILLNAINDAKAKSIPINITYYSWEVDEDSKKCNWLSVLVYRNYGVVIPPEKIKGLGKNRLTDDELKMIESTIPELDETFKQINWVWDSQHPTKMYNDWWNCMITKGNLVKEKYKDENNADKERIIGFEAYNPEEYNIVAGDHLSLAKLQQGFNLKQNIDKLSEYMILCRNLFKMTFIWLQQFNQSLSSVERMKFKGADISPQQSDFRDTTNPYIDADVVMGLMNAHKMDMDRCLGYDINIPGSPVNLKDSFRMLKIVKNRLSRDNVAIGLLFTPKNGSFKELPLPSELSKEWLNTNLN